jgi:hypothetical protein
MAIVIVETDSRLQAGPIVLDGIDQDQPERQKGTSLFLCQADRPCTVSPAVTTCA